LEGVERLPVDHRKTLGGVERLPVDHRKTLEGVERLPVDHRKTLEGVERLPVDHRKTFDAAERLPPRVLSISAAGRPKVICGHMPAWTPTAFGAAIFIALHYLLLRAASGRVEDRLGAFVLEAAAALGIAASLLLPRGTTVPTTKGGLVFAVCSGLAVSVASVLLFATLRRGGPVASTGTIVLGGGVALSALAAPWLFGEPFTLRRAAGVALGFAAMWVLGTES
jgi:hypothetical protein